jgi:hypothetical protein
MAAHLNAVGRADHRGEGDFVEVVVLVEPPGFLEKAPLLAPEQDRAAPVGCKQGDDRCLLRGGEVARQQVGAMDGRMRRFGADLRLQADRCSRVRKA